MPLPSTTSSCPLQTSSMWVAKKEITPPPKTPSPFPHKIYQFHHQQSSPLTLLRTLRLQILVFSHQPWPTWSWAPPNLSSPSHPLPSPPTPSPNSKSHDFPSLNSSKSPNPNSCLSRLPLLSPSLSLQPLL